MKKIYQVTFNTSFPFNRKTAYAVKSFFESNIINELEDRFGKYAEGFGETAFVPSGDEGKYFDIVTAIMADPDTIDSDIEDIKGSNGDRIDGYSKKISSQ